MPGVDQRPSAVLALMMALLIGLLAIMLFPLAEAGQAARFVGPAFPFLTGGLGVGAARYAIRTWRDLGSPEHRGAARPVQRLLIVLAMLANLMVIGFALIFILLATVGIGIG